jgi:hypothetical protein
MSMGSQQYAYLADHSYGRNEKGELVDLKSLVGKTANIGGEDYKVLHFADERSGYQGAIYQHMGSGDIVVAHRGTEFEREQWKDLIKTDGLMVTSRFNPQADDAIALSAEAVKLAREIAEDGGRTPRITHTGHSLGGTLAQISGHYFGHGGETFNAYGAASLNLRNPATGEFYRLAEGGNAFVNHVMAGDMVSAASPHYGQERRYANQREIDTLAGKGYDNDRGFDLRNDIGAAVATLRGGSHDMHNFLPWNGDNKRDVSMLAAPSAQQLAAQYDPMFDKYRSDVRTGREGIGLLGTNMQDVIQLFKDPLPAGEPARRAGGRLGAALQEGSVPDMRLPGHPANPRYQQAYAGMSDIDRSLNRAPDQVTERVAACLTACSVGMHSIERVALSTDGQHAFAVAGGPGPAEARERISVNVNEAMQRPVEASTAQWQQASEQLAQAQNIPQQEQHRTAVGPNLA